MTPRSDQEKQLIIQVASFEQGRVFLILQHPASKTYMQADGTLDQSIISAEEFWGRKKFKNAKAFAKKYGYVARYPGKWWPNLIKITFGLYAYPEKVQTLSWLIPATTLLFGLTLLKFIF